MAKRKPLSQKTRFEVFKRDNFKCQYCGRSAPDVILEVDHITPVAEGGDNDILNLITSCKECNRGKGKTRLDDNQAIAKQMAQLEELNERREQLEMLIQWKNELMDIRDKEVECIKKYYKQATGRDVTEYEEQTIIKRLTRQFSIPEIFDAMDIAISRYSPAQALTKIGGICYNRQQNKNDPLYPHKCFIKRVYRNKFRCDPPAALYKFMDDNFELGQELEWFKDGVSNCDTLQDLVDYLNNWDLSVGKEATWVIKG